MDTFLEPVTRELRRIADLLDARLPPPQEAAAPPPPAAPAFRPGPPPVPLDEAGERRFQALRAWRRERAQRDGVPPYVVAYDRSLRLLARAPPASAEDVRAVPGFGPAKSSRYGAEILDALRRAERPGPDA